jgi:beta-lactamase class C
MRLNLPCIVIVVLSVFVLLASETYAAGDTNANIETVVAQTIHPLMDQYNVPGMAVGVVLNGAGYVYSYGVMSKAARTPVTTNTLFEIGSLSKTFTATLASFAQLGGHLSLSGNASKYLPSLRGSSFDNISLLNLGTHTAGGLPLQVPGNITNDVQLMNYFRNWKPIYQPGTYRTYSNPSIGLLGVIAAKSMNEDFDTLMKTTLFAGLGLKNTYLDVPKAQMENYAQGYTKADIPIRMAPGPLAPEAYGIRTTADDMVRFIEANMGMLDLESNLQRAIAATHTGYYKLGAMTQDLIWEQYHYPVELAGLLQGNSTKVITEANPVTRIDPPTKPLPDVLVDKTGSTNGFAAYVAFVPGKKTGIVLLANKNYPIDARVTAAYQILTRLDDGPSVTSR